MAASADLGQDGGRFTCSVLRSQQIADVPACCLPARVSVQLFGCRVPARDPALERAADDGILGVLHDRLDEPGVFHRLLPGGHVLNPGDHQQHVPGLDLGQVDVDQELPANAVASAQLYIQSTGAGPGVCEIVLAVLGIDLPERFRDQRVYGLPDQLVALIAEQHLGLAVDKPDHPVLVHTHQGIRHSLQQLLVPHRLGRHLATPSCFRTSN